MFSSTMLRITVSGNNQFTYPFTWILVLLWFGTMVFWGYRLNNGLRLFDAMYIVPMFQVVWTLSSITNGGIYFAEFDLFSADQYLMYGIGVVLIMVGVYQMAPCGMYDVAYRESDVQVTLHR